MRYIFALVAALVCTPIWAGSYPDRAIRVIVPFAPGGGADVVMRILQPKLMEELGQPVIIDNRPGAGGNIGTEAAARASADGYTVLVATAAQAINHTLTQNLNWDLREDFTPVIALVENQSLLATHPSVQVTSVAELIDLAKSEPGRLSFASYGTGSTAHMNAELFMLMTGVEMLHVPYKGAGPAINDLVGGQVDLIFGDIAALLPHVKAGSVRSLAIGSKQRFAELPELETIAESGVEGYETGGFLALLAPSGTPSEAIEKLNAAAEKVLQMPDIRERLQGLACLPIGGTPVHTAGFINGEIDKWERVITKAGIELK